MTTNPPPATVREARELLRLEPPTRTAADVAADPHGRAGAPLDWRQRRPEYMTDAQRLAIAAETFTADAAMELALAVREHFGDLFDFVVRDVRIGLDAYERRRSAAVAVGRTVAGAITVEQLERMAVAAEVVRNPPTAEAWSAVDAECRRDILAAWQRGDTVAVAATYAEWRERRVRIRAAATELNRAKALLGLKNGPAIETLEQPLPRMSDLMDQAFGRLPAGTER